MKKIWLPLLLAALTLACTVISVPVAPSADLPTPTAPVSDLSTATALPPTLAPTLPAEQAVLVRAAQAVAALQAQDLTALAALVHPNAGLRFSPYAFVSISDRVFRPEALPDLLTDPTLYEWGVYDGSGLPISLTFSGYYAAFVYDQDYAAAPQIGLNQRLGAGNSTDNSLEFYPGAMVVEYHFPGIDPQYGGLDWRSLRLVFQKSGGEWYLVGIIHDQWTI